MIQKLPILTFHSIDQSGSVISVSSSCFATLLMNLRARNYHTISISDVVDWLQGKGLLPERSVVLTFDDGYENVYYNAFPMLEEMGFRATLFLTTGYCGKENNWPTQHSGVPLLRMLTWDQIKDMAESSFEIQAHTHTHPNLVHLTRNQAIEELLSSKKLIEDSLGKRVRFFAYPYGKFNDSVCDSVRKHFDAACSTSLGFADPTSNPHLLSRIDMYYFSGKFTSKLFISPWCEPYLQMRSVVRKARR